MSIYMAALYRCAACGDMAYAAKLSSSNHYSCMCGGGFMEEDLGEPSTANATQVGGSHYQRGADVMQHWDFAAQNAYDYFQGAITKYVHRWRDKKGLEDLRKARHYLDKYIEEIEAGRIK